MNNIEDKAQRSAMEFILKNPCIDTLDRECAREDYVAGYLAASVGLELKLEFARKQLRQLLVIAAENKDVYSVSIVRYALEVLK